MAQNAALSAQVMALQSQLDQVSRELDTCNAAMSGVRPENTDAEREAQAAALFEEILAAMDANQPEQAREGLARLLGEYGQTRFARSRGARLAEEMGTLGTSVSSFPVTRWFRGSASDLHLGRGTTLLVFWEVWCPHCQRELPELQALHAKVSPQVEIVALTRITKSATDERVEAFLTENAITFPVGQEDGAASTALAVSGIPAAALVQDGVVVWRGHPARLNEQVLANFLPVK